MDASCEPTNANTGHPGNLWTTAAPWGLMVFLAIVGLSVSISFVLRMEAEFDYVYRQAGLDLAQGKDFYSTDQYVYPPFAAWLAIPLANLAPLPARLIWLAINLIACWLLIHCAWQIARGGKLLGLRFELREHLIFWCGLGSGFFYLLNAVNHTQTDIVIGALVMAGCLAISRGKSMTAAVCFGLASAFKCTPLLWMVYFVWRGRIVPALTVAVVFLGVNLLPNLAASDPDGGWWLQFWSQRYLSGVTKRTAEVGAWHTFPRYNQSLNGAVHRLFFVDPVWTDSGLHEVSRERPVDRQVVKFVVLGSEVALALGCLVIMGRFWRRNFGEFSYEAPGLRDGLDCSIICILMLLLSPMSGKAHFSLLVLPGFCLARLAIIEKNRPLAVILALSVPLIVSGRLSLGGLGLYAMWWGNVTCHAVLLLAGCLLALRQMRTRADWAAFTSLPSSNVPEPRQHAA